MDMLHPICAGLDVHRDTIVACVRRVEGRAVTYSTETFSTTTAGLLALSAWLHDNEVPTVAMEATGVYWRPAWHLLEADFELTLANAMHVRNVPGRKTDVNDAHWIADLLAHGLIRGSFVPPQPIEELRMLTRTRKQLVRERASHAQRIDKVLQDANVKLGSVVTDIMGHSGRAAIAALIEGVTDPAAIASRMSTRLKATRSEIDAALRGHVLSQHRFLLRLHLDQVEHLDGTVARLDGEIERCLGPFEDARRRLARIPGVGDCAAATLLAEIGTDMTRFPTCAHLISWAGLCPRNDESAGKRRSTRLRTGDIWLKTMLVQCAWSATRAKGTYLQAQFQRLRTRRGAKKAVIAVAASILGAAYHMLKLGTQYQDLGSEHFAKSSAELAHSLVRRLERLGYGVTLHQEHVGV
jgi:transposase